MQAKNPLSATHGGKLQRNQINIRSYSHQAPKTTTRIQNQNVILHPRYAGGVLLAVRGVLLRLVSMRRAGKDFSRGKVVSRRRNLERQARDGCVNMHIIWRYERLFLKKVRLFSVANDTTLLSSVWVP
jgi:hypothetical protein